MERRLAVFYEADFPNMATHCDQKECGFSLYRGVLVQWDEDHDERILDVIDEMNPSALKDLLLCQEHEGSISFVWKNAVPQGFEEGGGIDVPDGDLWNIDDSWHVEVGKKRDMRDEEEVYEEEEDDEEEYLDDEDVS
jgi:hypothetical protein